MDCKPPKFTIYYLNILCEKLGWWESWGGMCIGLEDATCIFLHECVRDGQILYYQKIEPKQKSIVKINFFFFKQNVFE